MLGRDRLAVVSAIALLASLLVRTWSDLLFWLRSFLGRPTGAIELLRVGETVGMFLWMLGLIALIFVLSGWFRDGLVDPRHLFLFLTFLSAALVVWFVAVMSEHPPISFEVVMSVPLVLTPPGVFIWIRAKRVSLPSRTTPPSMAASFGRPVSLLVFWFAFYFAISFWNLYGAEWVSERAALPGKVMTACLVLGCITISYASVLIFRQPASYCSDAVKGLVGVFSFCWAAVVMYRLPRHLGYLTRTLPVLNPLLAWIDTALILGQAISLFSLCASLISPGTLHRLVDMPSRLLRNLVQSL